MGVEGGEGKQGWVGEVLCKVATLTPTPHRRTLNGGALQPWRWVRALGEGWEGGGGVETSSTQARTAQEGKGTRSTRTALRTFFL